MNAEQAIPRPPVWNWYRAYCVFMALLYLACFVFGIVLLVLDPSYFDEEAIIMRLQGAMLVVIGAALMVAYAVGLFLPRQPWAWIYGMVLICIGLTSCCCLPAALPLLIFWLKPELKTVFGRT